MKNRRSLQMMSTKQAGNVENYVGVPLTDKQLEKLQQLVESAPNQTEEDVAAHALQVGVERLLDDRDELDCATEEEHNTRTAQEQVVLLARAFEVRETLKTPSSIHVSLGTMDRYAVDQLRRATGMKLDDIAKILIAKGIAQMMKEHGIAAGKPKTIEV